MEFNPVSKLTQLDKMKTELRMCYSLTPEILQNLHDKFIVDYTYNSNAIEGNTLTSQETALVLNNTVIDKKPIKDQLEAMGHRDAFLYIEKSVRDKIPFSENVVRQIHSFVLKDRPRESGEYRHVPVRIIGAYHIPAKPLLIPEKMENLIAWFSNDKKLHPIERAALFHLKFEGIHPFVDGNGRTGRLIMNLMLMHAGYLPINIKYSERKRYYEAFDASYRDENTDKMTNILINEEYESLTHFLSLMRE